MQYPIIDLITDAYLNNGWTGLDIPQTITYEPIQLGNGDSSPENIRPIFPAKILNIGGVDVPVYGGALDVVSGVLVIDKAMHTFDGTESFSGSGGPNTVVPCWQETVGGANYSGYCLSNMLKKVNNYTAIRNTQASMTIYNNKVLLNPAGTQYASFSDAATYIVQFCADMYSGGTPLQVVYELETPITYQLTPTEVENIIGSKDDIAHRLKLPLPHYFPHPVIDALQRAAAGTQTADDTEILQHYLTPLGIGGI